MSQAITAIYKSGHFIPLVPVQGLQDNQSVRLTVLTSKKKEHPLMRFAGSISNEEADELSKVIEEEFEKVNPTCDKREAVWPVAHTDLEKPTHN